MQWISPSLGKSPCFYPFWSLLFYPQLRTIDGDQARGSTTGSSGMLWPRSPTWPARKLAGAAQDSCRLAWWSLASCRRLMTLICMCICICIPVGLWWIVYVMMYESEYEKRPCFGIHMPLLQVLMLQIVLFDFCIQRWALKQWPDGTSTCYQQCWALPMSKALPNLCGKKIKVRNRSHRYELHRK